MWGVGCSELLSMPVRNSDRQALLVAVRVWRVGGSDEQVERETGIDSMNYHNLRTRNRAKGMGQGKSGKRGPEAESQKAKNAEVRG